MHTRSTCRMASRRDVHVAPPNMAVKLSVQPVTGRACARPRRVSRSLRRRWMARKA